MSFNKTKETESQLNNYLSENAIYIEDSEVKRLNQIIYDSWNSVFQKSIKSDLKSKFKNIKIDFVLSEFELDCEEEQGATIFFHEILICDESTSESLGAYVKTLVGHQKTLIYLTSNYACIDEWKGTSNTLRQIFRTLKTADSKLGYFNPIRLENLIS